jgi:putative transposase
LTYKVKHGLDLSSEFEQARLVAEYAVKHGNVSTKEVKHIGMKAAFSKWVLRHYGRNKKIKRVTNPIFGINPADVVWDKTENTVRVYPLGITLCIGFVPHKVLKLNTITFSKEFAHVSVTVEEQESYEPVGWVGVDLNTNGHCAVVANPHSGKVVKLGRSTKHTQEKYRRIRSAHQKRGKKALRKVAKRQGRKVNDINHKISRKIVQDARRDSVGIKVEDLKHLRKNVKTSRVFRYALNSWPYYDLVTKIEYKARLLGVPFQRVNPAYTSQRCSRCEVVDKANRNGKDYKCSGCGHVDHADANAAFNIALVETDLSSVDRGAVEGFSVTPQEQKGEGSLALRSFN